MTHPKSTKHTIFSACTALLLLMSLTQAMAEGELPIATIEPVASAKSLSEKELGLVEPLSSKNSQALRLIETENERNKVLLMVLLAKERGNLKAVSQHCSKEEQADALALLKKVDKIAQPLDKQIKPKLRSIGAEVSKAYEKGVGSYLTAKGEDKASRCKLNLGNDKARGHTLDGMYDYFKDIEPND